MREGLALKVNHAVIRGQFGRENDVSPSNTKWLFKPLSAGVTNLNAELIAMN